MSKPASAPLYGVLAEFGSPAEVYHAAEKVRDAGYKRWDVYSPFPIHGIETAMGIGDSKLGWIAFFGAMAGACGGFGLQFWIHKFAYPLLIAGKPMVAYPAYVPVTFEPGILFTGFSALFGMLVLNGLPRWYHALFKSENFKKATDDGFFIAVEAKDPKFDMEAVRSLLASAGGKNIEVVED
jgi:hypothetical protein